MDRFYDIAFQSFIGGIPKAFVGYCYGVAGFVLFASMFVAYRHFRSGEAISPRSVWAGVFPATHWRGFSPRIDIIAGLLNMFVTYSFIKFVSALGVIATGVGILDALNAGLGERPQLIQASWLIVAAQFLAYLLANDLSTYVVHRAFHRIPALWAIHRAHHSAERLNYFTTFRDHPVEIVINFTIRLFVSAVGIGLCAYLTGTKIIPETLAFIVLFMESFWLFYSKLSHSHLPVSFFGAGNIVLGGPIMHQIHHSAEKHMWDKNFSRVTHIWDWVFGTLYLPRKGEIYRTGLNEHELGESNPHQTVRDFYVKPLADAWTIMKGDRIPYPTDHPRGGGHRVPDVKSGRPDLVSISNTTK